MNEILFQEFEVMHNPVLGAYALWAFADGFSSSDNSDENELTIWHLMTVLPLVFHGVSRKAITKRRVTSGLRSILDRDPDIDIALNEAIFHLADRIKNLQKRSFKSLNCAIAFGFIDFNEGYFIPSKRFKLPNRVQLETKQILKSSQKLGIWASKLSVFEYLTVLGVKP